MLWTAQVRVWLKPSVFDPQGNAVEAAIRGLGYDGIDGVRIGKYMSFDVSAETEAAAADKVKAVCESVLCNPVMETYAFTVQPQSVGASS